MHHFKLSLTERAYVMKACVSTALYYVVQIVSPPRYATHKLENRMFTFSWGTKTERVAQSFLQLPAELGGISWPSVTIMSEVLALDGFLDLTRDSKFVVARLIHYFLGTARGLFFNDA